ncbi:NPC intracellular cholesterol transporter 1 [Phytophthora ramorum]|uniref:NPC intracellular cholesterol transporter 1 n=1 Tax=Phytophthora ramorum TaxID=164328 RepID=UPI0030A5C03D|nr:NPC intracellular cholesterol transporter 1 [Phytophthora ramorum]
MRVSTLASLLLPLGAAQAASSSGSTSSSGVSSASSYVPWNLADNATNLALIESQLSMCTYSKVEQCIQSPELVQELGTLYRAPGYCIAMDSAYVNITTSLAAIPNRYYPTSVEDAYDAGFSNKFSEWSDANREQFEVDCPLLYNETIALGDDMLCCTESQYTGLSTQVRMIPGLCSACKENLRNIFCQFTCSPNNSLFLNIDEVRIMSGDDEHEGQIFPAVEEATYYVGKDWIRDIYDFCEDDSSFSLLCNPNQDCTDGYGLMEYMGKYAYNSIGSPEQINVTTMDQYSEEIQMTEFCHCDANATNCISPMNNKMTSCVGVCGSLCAVSSDDTRTYTDACYGASSASSSGSGSVVNNNDDSTWAELNEYLATNIPVTDWTALNYFLVIFGGVVGLLLIVGFIVAMLRERRYSAVDRRSDTPQLGSVTPDFHGVASAMAGSVVHLSFMDELMTNKLRAWAQFVSKGNRPKKIMPMVLVVVVICAAGLYNIDIETDPIKLWVSTASTSYEQRQHYGDIFNPFYRSEQVIMVPKDGGNIYRSSILKEAIRVQNVAANVTYTSDDGETTIELDDICWKATGTGCTVNSITQYFQNNMEHFEFYEKYGFELEHFSNCLYSPTTSDVALCTELKNALDDGDSLPSSMSDCPCLSAFGSPMNLYNTYLGGFPDGAESNYTLFLDSVAFVSSYLNYNYADDDKNDAAIKWEREYIKTMKVEAASNTVFDVYFYAEISVNDEVDAESSNGMGPVALSYCLMLIYISLGINRFKFSREFFISSKIVAGFCGVISIACGVASTVGLYMWFGVKLQLIIMEVVPFLSLAIGVDNIFLLIHAMTEKEDQLRRDQPSLFIGLEHNPKAIEEITTVIVSESLAYIGPSIFMASAAESVAFAFGAISKMPVVLWFAAMACCAVAINFCFQMTFFLSVLTLDKRRELSGKYDIIFKRSSSVTAQTPAAPETQQSSEPLVSLQPKTPAADDIRPSVVNENHSLTQVLDYCVDVYASILTHKLVKLIVLLAFLAWTLWSIYSMETLDQGLPQKEAMPSSSYMIEYFNALDVYLATGVPVYFIVETGYGRNPDTWSLNADSVETVFCKSKDICGTYSIPNIMNALANNGDETITHISPGTTYSWMDDFWGFVNPDSECCRVDSAGDYVPIETGNDTYTTLRSDDDTCLPSSDTVPPVPEDEYMSLFSMFATASAGTSCSYGGGSIYRGQFSIDTEPIPTVNSSTPAVNINGSGYGDEITAWSYMVTGTSNPTQQRYIDSYKQNLAAAEWISEKTGVDIWVYSLTYVYFEQYLTIIHDAYELIGLSLAAIFVITTLYLGNVFYSLTIALTATNIVVLVLGLMQPLDIMLNGLSIVNLIIAAGIAVEFSGHYVRFFAKARGTGDERARDALRQVLTSVLFGITITKVIGLSVLTLADSRVFKKYYFRMYMMVVVCGVLNGMLLLPVLLSTIMDVKSFFLRKRSRKSELPSAPITRVE